MARYRIRSEAITNGEVSAPLLAVMRNDVDMRDPVQRAIFSDEQKPTIPPLVAAVDQTHALELPNKKLLVHVSRHAHNKVDDRLCVQTSDGG